MDELIGENFLMKLCSVWEIWILKTYFCFRNKTRNFGKGWRIVHNVQQPNKKYNFMKMEKKIKKYSKQKRTEKSLWVK